MKRTGVLLVLAAAVHGAAYGIAAAAIARRAAPAPNVLRPDGETLAALDRRITALEATSQVPQALAPRPSSDAGESGDLPRLRSSRSYLDEGNVYCAVGQWERAVDRFSRAVEQEPDLAAAHYNRALALARLGRPGEALAGYDRAAALTPDDADIFNNRGLLLLDTGETARARADFERAALLAPSDPAPLVNLGLLLQGAGNHAAALALFDTALRRSPTDAGALYGAALALAALGRQDDAATRLQMAVLTEPSLAGDAAGEPLLAEIVRRLAEG